MATMYRRPKSTKTKTTPLRAFRKHRQNFRDHKLAALRSEHRGRPRWMVEFFRDHALESARLARGYFHLHLELEAR